MVAPPGIVWRQRQYPENTPDPIIEDPAAEKSSMPAVVLDQEKTLTPYDAWGGDRDDKKCDASAATPDTP